MAKITCKRVEPIIIDFEDETFECFINVDALIILNDEFGNLVSLSNEAIKNPYDVGAKLLYAGIKTNRRDFTLDDAKLLVCNCGAQLINLVTDAFVRCCGNVGGEEFTKKYIAELERMIDQNKKEV